MRNQLGEFEEIVLLLVAAQHDHAYGLSITRSIEGELGRSVTMSSVHTALYRLEEKGLVQSRIGSTSESRRGRSKRLFTITSSGKEALVQAREARVHLWNLIPEAVIPTS